MPKSGRRCSNCEDVMGKHDCDNINDNGERLVDFYLNNNCVSNRWYHVSA